MFNIKSSFKKIKSYAIGILSICLLVCLISGGTLLVSASNNSSANAYVKLAHYEFNDSSNLGKDSVGNYDLVNQGVSKDVINGGVALKDGGLFYAPALDDKQNDISDLVKGSYSLSMRVYLRAVNDGANYLIANGAYGSHFQVAWAYEGLAIELGNSQFLQFGTSGSALGGKPMFDTTFAWYRITMIYDESAMTFRVLATKESDETYLFDATANLTATSLFGGHVDRTFTIGAQSHFGEWLDQWVNTTIFDGTKEYTVYPNISDLRLYSGAIDNAEIQAIKEYDDNNNAQKDEGYNAVSHYEFKYATNLGKDTLGNYDLVAGSGLEMDYEVGGVVLGKTDGIFYAPALNETGADFSDAINGSYSLSMRVYLCEAWEGANYLISTGHYGSNLQIDWAYGGLAIELGNGQSLSVGQGASSLGGVQMLSGATPAWYRISLIYNEKDLSVRVVVTKEKDSSFLIDETATLTNKALFGGHEKSFTVGAQSKFGAEVDCLAQSIIGHNNLTAEPRISDLRIYTGAIDDKELSNIATYDVEHLEKEDLSNAVEQEVAPIVWYEFNDKDNLGKDSMGNFDLLVGGRGLIDYNESGFVTFTKAKESYLYAPALFGNLDWSDLLKGGYTLSFNINTDNTIGEGDRYAICTSNYANAFQIIAARSGYEVTYSSGGHKKHTIAYATGNHKDQWVNITITMDAETSKLAFYVNGLLFDERVVDNYESFTAGNHYAFAIGGQGTTAGADGTQYFEGSIDDVRVYDFALSSRNIKDLYDKANGNAPLVSLVNYKTVKEIKVDTEGVDLVISNNNSVENIISKLPATVTAVNTSNEEEVCSVVWLNCDNGLVKGYLQGCSSANAKGLFAEVRLSYLVDFASATHGKFVDVKVNGEAYNGEEILTGENKTLTFKVNANDWYSVSSVAVNNQKITPDEDGVYTFVISDYTKVSAYFASMEYTITYVLNNGQNNEEQIYGYGEDVILADYFVKEGFVFAGWYDNEALTGEKITVIDSQNPANITLYAKWVDENEHQSNVNSSSIENEKGCKSAIEEVVFGLPLCLLAVFVMKKKRG